MGISPHLLPEGSIRWSVSVTTFVSLGNGTQPFQRLIDAVLALAPRLPQPVIVQHGNTVVTGGGFVARSFMSMEEFAKSIAHAELLILHGGAGSVIHAIQVGKIPVIMPRLAKYGEIVDDHQLEFASALAKVGKVVLAEKSEDLTEAVAEALRRQRVTRASLETPRTVHMIDAVLRGYAQRLGR